MAEKAIIEKMSLYETMTMIVPGTLIVFCVWLLKPQYWMHFLDKAGYTTSVNYLYDIALVILMFVLVYVAGLINYLIIDWLWGVIRLRNNPCMIKSSLNDKVQSKKYIKLAELIKRLNSDNKEICDLNSITIEDIYYEAYTYAFKKNSRSNISFLENQVAMIKGLIFPMSVLVYILCPEDWSKFWTVFGTLAILIYVALRRQKKIITLVLEDYEYEKRLDDNK